MCHRQGHEARGNGAVEGSKEVAEAGAVTHPALVSEAHAGMMVTPSVQLVRPLGEGGMGAVWVADHLSLRTQVVVKFIASGLKGSKEAHDRFSREAAAASQVKSPHVVQTFDHGITDDGVPYIVMELLEGRDLGAYLEHHVKIPPELVLAVVGQLARALDRAHERGIVHRDIKPGNIYLCDAGRDGEVFIKLLDFGIAKGVELPHVDSGTKTGSMIGSPFYMSPEQILGSKGVDHRSDLWSVGVVAYEALTGRKPFDAETMGGLAIRIHSEPLPVPSVVAPELPHGIDAWFARACARNVDERFSSAKELAEELARALGAAPPRSLDPRISQQPASARGVPVDGGATTLDAPGGPAIASALPAGAATDAGMARSTSPRSRSRVLVLLAIVVVGMSLAFFGVRAAVRGPVVADHASARAPDPSASGASTGAAAGSAAQGAAIAPAPAVASAAVAPGPSAVAGHPPPESSAAPAASARRPARPRQNPGQAGVSPPSSSPLPSSTPAATPKPASSGHDIF